MSHVPVSTEEALPTNTTLGVDERKQYTINL